MRQNAILIQLISQKGDLLTPFYYLSNFSENKPIAPSPLVGEGGGEGEHTIITPTFILPHQGGG